MAEDARRSRRGGSGRTRGGHCGGAARSAVVDGGPGPQSCVRRARRQPALPGSSAAAIRQRRCAPGDHGDPRMRDDRLWIQLHEVDDTIQLPGRPRRFHRRLSDSTDVPESAELLGIQRSAAATPRHRRTRATGRRGTPGDRRVQRRRRSGARGGRVIRCGHRGHPCCDSPGPICHGHFGGRRRVRAQPGGSR